MNEKRNKSLEGRVFRRYISRFFLFVGIYTLLYIVGFFGLYIWGHGRFWYASDLLYPLLKFVNEYAEVAFILGWGVGIVLILFIQWRRIAKDITLITATIGKMALDPSATIELPNSLPDVENALRSVQLDMQRHDDMAREAEQRKNDMVIYLAHDLKTPLTSVIGYLTLLRDESDIPPQLREKYLNVATSKAQRLEDLVNEFFEITRFNLKGLTLEPTRFSLSRMLEQINDEFRPLYAEKQLVCNAALQPDIEVMADAGKLERVIDNLLRNAVNYSYRNSELQLRLFAQNGYATIQVENRGETIPEHKLVHIFEQFYRLDTSRSADGSGGAGLGLAIAREIVERHGGGISAQSADERILFTVQLPQNLQTIAAPVTTATGTIPVINS